MPPHVHNHSLTLTVYPSVSVSVLKNEILSGGNSGPKKVQRKFSSCGEIFNRNSSKGSCKQMKIFQPVPHFPGVHQRSVSISSKSIGVVSGSPVSGEGSEILAAGSIAWAGFKSAAGGASFPLIAAAVCSRMCCTVQNSH